MCVYVYNQSNQSHQANMGYIQSTPTCMCISCVMCALSVCVCVCEMHAHACALHLCIARLCVDLSA